VSPIYCISIFDPIAAPTIIKGTRPKAKSVIYQQKKNDKITPPISAQQDSAITAKASVLTPFKDYTSEASIALNTPAALS
jgi:hypothetical protein